MNCRKCGIELNKNNTYKSTPTICKDCKIQYNKEHPPTEEKRKEYKRRWYQKNKEKTKIQKKIYRQTHQEEIKESLKRYRISPVGRKSRRKSDYKRRGLGHIFMNEPFENSEGHHLDHDFILHIPKELHRSIPHNLTTGYNMELINTKAFEYIISILKS